jgi:hypothetical protein
VVDEPLLPVDDLMAMLADVGCTVELDERGQPFLAGKTKKVPQDLLRQLRLNREAIRQRIPQPEPPRAPQAVPDGATVAWRDDDGALWLVEGKGAVVAEWYGLSLFVPPELRTLRLELRMHAKELFVGNRTCGCHSAAVVPV